MGVGDVDGGDCHGVGSDRVKYLRDDVGAEADRDEWRGSD